MRCILLTASLLACVAAPIRAQTTRVGGYSFSPPVSVLPGHVVNRIEVDFDGQFFGQQMVVELSKGSIYQDGFGGETPPSPAFFSIAPSLEWDTFVTIGGYDSSSAEDVLTVGGSTELELGRPPKSFDTQRIDITWAPAPGVVVEDQGGYPVFQLTLSEDAEGVVSFFSNANSQGTVFPTTAFSNGRLFVPEPGAALIAAMALVGAAVGRRRVD